MKIKFQTALGRRVVGWLMRVVQVVGPVPGNRNRVVFTFSFACLFFNFLPIKQQTSRLPSNLPIFQPSTFHLQPLAPSYSSFSFDADVGNKNAQESSQMKRNEI